MKGTFERNRSNFQYSISYDLLLVCRTFVGFSTKLSASDTSETMYQLRNVQKRFRRIIIVRSTDALYKPSEITATRETTSNVNKCVEPAAVETTRLEIGVV